MSQVQKKSSKAEVIQKPNFSVATNYLEEFGGAGLENITSDNMSMPFIKLISDASPERKKMNEKYIEGADTGMIANTITKKLYDGLQRIKQQKRQAQTDYRRGRAEYNAGEPQGADLMDKAEKKFNRLSIDEAKVTKQLEGYQPEIL